jgi:isopenicillin-N epimerase
VIVDGAHAPALLDSPVCGDFWTGNLHKWACAPRGTAVLYVATERHHEVVPNVVSWSDLIGFPLSFDYTGTTDATAWLAAPTSLDLMESLGFAAERKRLAELVTTGAALVAEAIGGVVAEVGNPAPTMRIVTLPDGMVTDDLEGNRVGAFIAARTGVETSVTTCSGRGFVRLSAHLYTTFDDFAVAAVRMASLFDDRAVLDRIARG